MKLEIPYGHGCQTLTLPDDQVRGVIRCELEGGKSDGKELVEAALHAPISSPRLRELAMGASRVLLITSDHTRPVPSHITLPAMLTELRSGNPSVQVKILVATGVHRQSTQAEMEQKYGRSVVENEEILIHDAFHSPMVALGKLDSGCLLTVNALAEWADLVVSDGFIEPHFFAGFSGGRKSILPGISSSESIMANHCAKLIGSDMARTGILSGNPIHADMVTAARLAGLRFIVNVVLDDQHQIVAAFAGDAVLAHEAGCAYSRRLFSRPITEASIVVTSNGGYPLDQNIYQSVKSMTAAEACVRQGGFIICASECADGNGGDAFVRWFSSANGPKQVLERIEANDAAHTVADQWQAQILARVMCKAKIAMVCREASRAEVESMGMLWFSDVNEAVAYAKEALGKDYDGVTVIPNGVSVIMQ